MSASHLALLAIGAVLVFWVVGAYNRVVRLRTALVARFVPVDERLRERQALLVQHVGLLDVALAHAAQERLAALRAACAQADLARERARARPGVPGSTTSLRLADDILADARSRLPAAAAPGSELEGVQAGLSEADHAVTAARREFNVAVTDYNVAVRQFPTIIVARVFGFRPAGPF